MCWYVKQNLTCIIAVRKHTYQSARGSHRQVFHHQPKSSLHQILGTICGGGWYKYGINKMVKSPNHLFKSAWCSVCFLGLILRLCVYTLHAYWLKGMTGSKAGLGAVPRAPLAKQRTVQPEPRKGGSNWAMSPCSRYRSPPEMELSNIWLVIQLANNEPGPHKDSAGMWIHWKKTPKTFYCLTWQNAAKAGILLQLYSEYLLSQNLGINWIKTQACFCWIKSLK